jgi:predicted small metal-binding protein
MATEYTCQICGGFKVHSSRESEVIQHAAMHLNTHHPELKMTDAESEQKIRAQLKTV